MFAGNDAGRMEYAMLMERSRTVERTGVMTWTIATTAATVLLAWAIADDSPGRLLAVVLATATGLYPMLHARRQTKLIAGYVEEFHETPSGPQWHTRLGRVRPMPSGSAHDWAMTAISVLVVLTAVVFSWRFAESARNGGVIAGLLTACGVAFTFHALMETAQLSQTDFAALWRKADAGPREMERRVS